jgi:hypothetical protein
VSEQPSLDFSPPAQPAMRGPCGLCAIDDGNYDFTRACCRARFLLHVPVKALRAGWMGRWKRQLVGNPAFFAEIEKAVRERWEKMKGRDGGQ